MLIILSRWLKESLKAEDLIIIEYGSKEMIKLLEQAVRAGLPVMIEVVYLICYCMYGHHFVVFLTGST